MTLADGSSGTEVTIVHEGFTSAEDRESHVQGWSSCLDRLPAHLAATRS